MFLKRLTAFFIFIAAYIAGLFGNETNLQKPVDTEDFQVVSYVVSGNIQSPDSVHAEDFDIIDHVILFGCATFDKEGQVHIDKTLLEPALENLRNAIGERDVKITLNLLGPGASDYTDWNDQMEKQAIVHTEAFESGVLEENIKSAIADYAFDGVHFDYEYPISEEAWKAFNRFLVRLDKTMPDAFIGVAVSAWDVGLNTKALSAIDSIELMLYDHYDSEGRHSTYETAVETAKGFLEEFIPLEMVHFGLPFYARPTDSDAYWYGYNGYYDALDENNFFHDESIDKDFWFNTPDVIADKTAYALENGFGGVMIWHYSCDLPATDPNSLLGSIGTVLDR